MTLALLCSGQGRQSRAMLDLFADDARAAPILAEASDVLGLDIFTVLRTEDETTLFANRTSQILCFTRGLVAAACLAPTMPFVVAGYSVGEMTAWGIAGIWSPELTLHLTAARAEAMDAASGTDDRLGFIRGLPRERVDALVARFDCAIAIVNPDLLFVIGGERTHVAQCCSAALEQGATSARSIAVHVASHTPRLSNAVAPFLAALDSSEPVKPARGRTLIGAADASIVSGGRGIAGLAGQIDTMVDWAATLEAVLERGVDRILELGPGTALADMVRAVDPALEVRAIDDFRSVSGIRDWLAR
ncbi:acyltransferase domain-containing protein [Sphingomonas faeni]|uniref:acyltransferase domain-containing protein n=1 Tax=Sphingomonas faeni TaxID=185950 RepID=UPI0024132570|nr:acyltransferase domain-containing protein [Sphingomonas faeni]